MAPDVTAIERLTDAPVAVQPADVEAEFSRIWQETTGTGAGESSIRLRVLNFIGIGLTDDARDRFGHVMEALPERHPCRGIMAMTAPGHDAVIASISAHCWRSGSGNRHVCSEEVLLQAAPGQERPLASAVLALLVPELPVAAWLIGDLDFDHAIATEIIGAAERVFIDSTGSPDARAILRSAAHAVAGHDIEVCDLAWCRLGAWRGLVAQFFDGDDGPRQLASLQSIEIVSGGNELGSESLLLAGWLVSCLGLSIADVSRSAGRIEATLYDGSNGVRLAISASGGAIAPLERVSLKTKDAAFLVELHHDSGHMHVREEWPDARVRRTVAPSPTDEALLFAEALDDADDPGVFLGAMNSALSLLGDDDVRESPAQPS